MTSFKQYLNEERTTLIHLEDAVDLALKNCQKYMKFAYGNKYDIYRGIESFSGDYGWINSNIGSLRKSAYTENYTTLLIDNLPSWKGWPKRSRGIVCSTDEDYSNNYGNIYYVIPYDNAKIAVAPDEDIFSSFKFLSKNGDVVRTFNRWIKGLFEIFHINTPPKTFKDLKAAFSRIYDDAYSNGNSWKTPVYRYDIFNSKDYMNRLDNLLNPNKNGFKMGIKNWKPNREVWIQGECLMIKQDEINTFLDAYKEVK